MVFMHLRPGRVASGLPVEGQAGPNGCAAGLLGPPGRCGDVCCAKWLQTAASPLCVWSFLYILCPLDMTGTV